MISQPSTKREHFFSKSQATIGNSDSDTSLKASIVNSDIVVSSWPLDCDCRPVKTSTGRRIVHRVGCEYAPQRKNHSFKAFDELSRKMVEDGAFWLVFDEWGSDPGCLYEEVCRLGYDRVRAEILEVRTKKGIANKGAYLRTRLRRLS